VIELDEWGYPIIDSRIPPGLTAHAKRAVNACPALALKLTQAQERRTRG
jgi:ferredoxin